MNKENEVNQNIQEDLNDESSNQNPTKPIETVKAEPVETNLESESVSNNDAKKTDLNSGDLKGDGKNSSISSFGIAFADALIKTNANFVNDINHKNESDQQEPIDDSYQLNFSLITTNPIENFYYHIYKSINSILDEYFEQKFSTNKAQIDEIKNLSKKIVNDKQAIIDKKRELKYTKRLWANGFIIFSFILIIGLAFIKIFKENLAAIKEFKRFRSEKNQIIGQTINKRFSLIFYAMSTIILRDIYKFVFNKYGIKISEKLPATRLMKFLNNKNIIDIHSGISGKYKNTPFFDIIYRTLEWEFVTTSNSVSFPYKVAVTRYDSKNRPYTSYETRYETLTAYHRENTPFVYVTNSLILLTNFQKDFCFYLQPGSEKKPFLENKNFTSRYVVQTPSNNSNPIDRQNVSQFFTLKAQEDYVNWFNLNDGQVFPFVKNYNAFVITNNNYRIDNLNKMNYTVDYANLLENSINVDLDVTKTRLKNFILGYFEKFTKMMQMPLLSPVINREWYSDDNQYHIANEMETTDDDSKEEFDDLYIINRFLQTNFVWFNTKMFPAKPIWFSLKNKSKSKKVTYYNYIMNSFWSKQEFDYVRVYGRHVGWKTIIVPYRRFYPLSDFKFLAYVSFKGVIGKEVVICPKFINLLSESQYTKKDLANNIVKNCIWTSDPSWLENLKNVNQLIEICESFNSLNQQKQMILIIDEYGAYVISNTDDLSKNKDIEKILENILKFFS